jgi:hypothetical protein
VGLQAADTVCFIESAFYRKHFLQRTPIENAFYRERIRQRNTNTVVVPVHVAVVIIGLQAAYAVEVVAASVVSTVIAVAAHAP